jgi:hypothetical protein
VPVLTQRLSADVLYLPATEKDLAAGDVFETQDEFGGGRLATPGLADKTDSLPGLQLERHAIDGAEGTSSRGPRDTTAQ